MKYHTHLRTCMLSILFFFSFCIGIAKTMGNDQVPSLVDLCIQKISEVGAEYSDEEYIVFKELLSIIFPWEEDGNPSRINARILYGIEIRKPKVDPTFYKRCSRSILNVLENHFLHEEGSFHDVIGLLERAVKGLDPEKVTLVLYFMLFNTSLEISHVGKKIILGFLALQPTLNDFEKEFLKAYYVVYKYNSIKFKELKIDLLDPYFIAIKQGNRPMVPRLFNAKVPAIKYFPTLMEEWRKEESIEKIKFDLGYGGGRKFTDPHSLQSQALDIFKKGIE